VRTNVNFSLWLQTHGVGQNGMSKLNAGDLAQAAKISRAAAYAYVSGTRVPDDPEVIARIARVLHVDSIDIPEFAPKSAK
jgi:hypothetical protein